MNERAGARAEPELAARLHRAAIRLLRRVRAVDPESGIGPARLSALSVLVFGGARSMGELATAEQVTAATMSRLVSGLEADGLVERRRSQGDARVVQVRATARGRAVVEAGRARRVAALAALLGELDREEAQLLKEAVDLLEERLGMTEGGGG